LIQHSRRIDLLAKDRCKEVETDSANDASLGEAKKVYVPEIEKCVYRLRSARAVIGICDGMKKQRPWRAGKE